MSISRKITEGAGSGGSGTYVDDVFSTYLYTGNGANNNIVNGVDLAGEGGLVWIKNRSTASDHILVDTERGVNQVLVSSDTSASVDHSGNDNVWRFNADGFSARQTLAAVDVNTNAKDYVSWTWRKAPKFFDVVTWTGDGSTPFTLPHNLGTSVGMSIVKCTSHVANWVVNHVDLPDHYLHLDKTDAKESDVKMVSTDSTVTFTGSTAWYNAAGREYVAYVFAHDAQEFGTDSDESIIKCGSISTDGVGQFTDVDLGFEPQWVLVKRSSAAGDWWIYDTMRGLGAPATSGTQKGLRANLSDNEVSTSTISINASGLVAYDNYHLDPNSTYIYMAIRRPNKPASEFEPEELFAVTSTTQDNTAVQTPLNRIDLNIQRQFTSGEYSFAQTRLQGNIRYLKPNEPMQEEDYGANNPRGVFDTQGKVKAYSSNPNIIWSWRRQAGFLDITCHESDGQPTQQIYHNLGVEPEMAWIKNRSSSKDWFVHHKDITAGKNLRLNTADGETLDNTFSAATFTESYWTTGNNGILSGGQSQQTYIAYLFASVPGICDIGTYTATQASGTDLDIDCGFTNGARFVLIKRTDAAGDWWVFDTVRGITSSSSPRLNLNDTSAQSVGNYIEPFSKGFTVTTNIMPTGTGKYIYMAIA